jgi:N-methylhydantoinase B
VTLRAGDELVLETAGGGGFGPASHRAAEQIAQDLDAGYLSADGAKAYSDQR